MTNHALRGVVRQLERFSDTEPGGWVPADDLNDRRSLVPRVRDGGRERVVDSVANGALCGAGNDTL